MRFLVTGVAGFIGSNLAAGILAADPHARVVGIDSLTDYYERPLKLNNLSALACERFEFIQQDVNDADLDALLSAVDVVFHEAGQPGVRKSWGREFSNYVSQNINATQALLEAALRSNPSVKIVYASSSSVYGDAERFPTREDDRPMPTSPYGVTKLAAEHLCSLYASNFGLNTVSLRYFTVYGPGQRPDMAFHKFISAALRGREITVYGDGEQVREFTFVTDIVEANLLAAAADTPPGAVVNLSGGSSISVNEILAELEQIHGQRLRISRLRPVAGDVRKTGGDTSRARELLRWTPRVQLKDGLRREYDWLVSAPLLELAEASSANE